MSKRLDIDELEQLRRSNLGRLLDQTHLWFDKRALQRLRDQGYPMLTAAHGHVLRTMSFEGSRITEMAKQANISKQAMSKLVASFVDYGFLEWHPDPDDKRSFIAHITPAGRQLLTKSIGALKQTEADLQASIGEDGVKTLRELLTRIRSSWTGKPARQAPPTYRRRRQ